MPLGGVLLLGTEFARAVGAVVLLGLDRADRADLGIIAPKVSLRVEQRMDVKTGSRRPSSQLTKPQYQLLLQLVGEPILGPEEDYTTLRDWVCKLMCYGRRLVGVGACSEMTTYW